MGIVQRQATWNALNSYAGVVLGLVNKLVFFNFWLTEAQFGLIELLITFMLLGAEISNFGINKIVIRFFPYFKDLKEKEGKFIFFVSIYSLLGLALVLLILFAFKDFFIAINADKSPLFVSEFNYVFIVIIAYKLYWVLQSISISLLNSVLPSFLWNIILRIVQLVLILLLHYEFITFRGFLNGLSIGYFIPALVLFFYVASIRKINWIVSWDWFKGRTTRILFNYGMYSSLGEMTSALVNRVDILMLAALAGEGVVKSYAIAYYIARLIQMPALSIQAIVAPLVANHMKKRSYQEVFELYQKTAINNLVIGGLVFIGLIANIDILFEAFPDNAESRNPMIFLGVGIMFNITTSIHKIIIYNSKHFKFNLYANFLLFILICITNYLLIPRLGVTGAAIATAASLLIYNWVSCFYVYKKFGFHPFNIKTLYNLIVGAIVLAIALHLPIWGHYIVDIAIRSVVIIVLYGLVIIQLNISPDITQMVQNTLRKLYIRIFKS